MSNQINTSNKLIEELIRIDWVWDPPPFWLKLDEKMLHQFAQIELDFKLKEQEIKLEKMRALREIIG